MSWPNFIFITPEEAAVVPFAPSSSTDFQVSHYLIAVPGMRNSELISAGKFTSSAPPPINMSTILLYKPIDVHECTDFG